jgi:hypothetical protein
MKVFGIGAAALAILSIVQTTSAQTAAGNAAACDPNTCKLPSCNCPLKSPPGGLLPQDVPQFVTITFDDSIQPELLATARDLLNVKQVLT